MLSIRNENELLSKVSPRIGNVAAKGKSRVVLTFVPPANVRSVSVNDGAGGVPPQFEAEGVVVLLKGGTQKLPLNVSELMESEWPQFRKYANASTTSPNEKSQCYERAKRRSAVRAP